MKRVLSKDGEWVIEENKESMAFKPKGVQYRVSTPNLQEIKDFPYDYKWSKPPNKALAIAKVVATLVNPNTTGKGAVHFEVSTRREKFGRTFSSIADLMKLCDNIEEQIISKDMVACDRVLKARFDCTPPIVLEGEYDNVTLSMDSPIDFADQTYVLCEGWMFEGEAILVKDVMHSTTHVDGAVPVSEVAKLMSEKMIGSVLVDDPERKIVGIFTERDIVRRVVAKGIDPMRTSVKEVMSSPVMTVNSDTPIDEAAKLMTERKIRRLPICEGDRIVGIVTDRDVIRTVTTLLRKE